MQFTICILILLGIFIYFYKWRECKTRENFVIGKGATTSELNIAFFDKFLFPLPGKIQDIILPKLDEIKNRYSPPNEDEEVNHDYDKESLVEDDYVSRKDPYVTNIDAQGNAKIDADKMKIMRDEYVAIDSIFEDLKKSKSTLYEKIIN